MVEYYVDQDGKYYYQSAVEGEEVDMENSEGNHEIEEVRALCGKNISF